jgi:ferredoxin
MIGRKLMLDAQSCAECGLCVAVCAYDALVLRPTVLEILHDECVLCDACVVACPTGALAVGQPGGRLSVSP